jgi:hypothetical protein
MCVYTHVDGYLIINDNFDGQHGFGIRDLISDYKRRDRDVKLEKLLYE